MTVSAVIFFRNGQPLSVDEERADSGAERMPKDVVWIGMSDPTTNDLRIVQDRYGLSLPSCLHLLSASRHPHVEAFDHHWLVGIPAVGMPGREGVSVLVGRSYVVTVDHGASDMSRRLGARLRGASRVSDYPAPHVVRETLTLAIDDYDAAIEALEREVLASGSQTLSDAMVGPTSEPAAKLRVSLVAIIDTLGRLVEAGGNLDALADAQPMAPRPPPIDDVLDRARTSALWADAVLQACEAAIACRESRTVRDKGRRRTALMAGLLLSLATILVVRILAADVVSRPVAVLLALIVFAARFCLTLCAAVLLVRFLKSRSRT